MGKITKFENYENLTIGYFSSNEPNFIKITKNTNYYLDIKGIKDLVYINNDEDYNDKTNIQICSNNSETALACLIIE